MGGYALRKGSHGATEFGGACGPGYGCRGDAAEAREMKDRCIHSGKEVVGLP